MKINFLGAWQCANPELPEPEFHPHEVYCYKFYECAHGHPYEMTCSAPLNWDQSKKQCDAEVDCGTLKTSTWVPPTPTTTPSAE